MTDSKSSEPIMPKPELTHPDDLDADVELAERLSRGEIPRYQLEKRYIRKDGTVVVDVMLSGSVLRGRDGSRVHFITQIEDVTHRKRLDPLLRSTFESIFHRSFPKCGPTVTGFFKFWRTSSVTQSSSPDPAEASLWPPPPGRTRYCSRWPTRAKGSLPTS